MIKVKAFGKINLALAITGKRQDGYHTLDTVMQSISLYNQITLERAEQITLKSNDAALPTDIKNTAFLAAKLFLEEIGEKGLDIFVEKNIPYEAGLGSASADAAGVLAGANRLFNQPLSQKKLLEIALKVGADVPFCLVGATKRAKGIGEILTPLKDMPSCKMLIIKPNVGMSTPLAYKLFDELETPFNPNINSCVAALEEENFHKLAKSCGNAFEQCCKVFPIEAVKAKFIDFGADCATMSGSGTAVVGLFSPEKDLKLATEFFKSQGYSCYQGHPVNYSIKF